MFGCRRGGGPGAGEGGGMGGGEGQARAEGRAEGEGGIPEGHGRRGAGRGSRIRARETCAQVQRRPERGGGRTDEAREEQLAKELAWAEAMLARRVEFLTQQATVIQC